MPDTQVWCLLIDHDHMPTFGEPFPEELHHDDTTHRLKVKIKNGLNRINLAHLLPNEIEIWRCKSSKLSVHDSFDRTKKLLSMVEFDDDDGDVQHLGVAQRVMGLKLRDDELLLALIPRKGMWCLFLYSVFPTELSMSYIA
ncbi:hypothetical protein BJY52DRAFT_1190584 [Lactarius psammicola]|nr:hypothetical protein BJY52DRAFT_1190584 [Lactarius psammicola]